MTYAGYAVLVLFAIIGISAIIDMALTFVDSARESRLSRMRLVLFGRDLLSAVRKARAERELEELIERCELGSGESDVLHAREVLALADRIGHDERTRAAAVAWARQVVAEEERRLDSHRAARGVKKTRGAK